MVFAVLAALIPTAITGWISYRQTQRSLERGVDQELRGRAVQSSRIIDRWIATRQHEAQDLAGSPEIRDIVSEMAPTAHARRLPDLHVRLADFSEAVHQRTSEIVHLAVGDSTGAIIATGGPVTSGLPASWDDSLHEGKTVIGRPYWDSVTQRAMLSIAVSVWPGSARRKPQTGSLIVAGDLTAVLAVLHEGTSRKHERLSLITLDGTTLVDALGNLSPAKAIPVADTVLAALASDTSLGDYRRPDGTAVVGAVQALEEVPWAVLAEIPRREAYAEVTRMRNVTLFILLGALFTVGVVAYQLAQLIVRPLDRLTRGAGEVASGDFPVALPPSGGGEVGYLTDVFNYMVERLREGREELERLSVTDALTGLDNRRNLVQNMRHEVQRSARTGKPFGMLIMDIDEFKAINDRYGHHAGDQVLITVADVLRDSVRVVDSVARYGGEEFVVVLPETDLARSVETAERIRTAVESQALSLGDVEVRVTVSVGVAEFPSDGRTVDAVIGSADRMLYRAKESGRNRVVATRPVSSAGHSDGLREPPAPSGQREHEGRR